MNSDASNPPSASSNQPATVRQASIDAYRGIVMFLLLAEVLHLSKLAESFLGNSFFEFLRFHTTHVEWIGCSLHDMIQPSFSFLVGVSVPFSIAARLARQSSMGSLLLHAAWRAVLLIALGIALRSLHREQTNFTFVDTLTQIGLGYFFLFCIALLPGRLQIGWVVGILVGYWLLFVLWPLPSTSFDFRSVGVPLDWPHLMSGFQSHWNKNANPAHVFDVLYLGQFPQAVPYVYNSGGYCTLNFIPTLATMILGVLAGGILKSGRRPGAKFGLLIGIGAAILAGGWLLGAVGICPIVKRIWTPAFVLYSGGICWMTLGVLFAVCDWIGWKAWAWPVIVIGANSITAYVMSWTIEKPIQDFLQRHFGQGVFYAAGEVWQPLLLGAATLAVMWLILLWLYRKRIFIRI